MYLNETLYETLFFFLNARLFMLSAVYKLLYFPCLKLCREETFILKSLLFTWIYCDSRPVIKSWVICFSILSEFSILFFHFFPKSCSCILKGPMAEGIYFVILSRFNPALRHPGFSPGLVIIQSSCLSTNIHF